MEKSYSISCVGQYVQKMINYFRKQTFLLINNIFENIYTNFIAHILTNNFDLVICSYILSSGGRNAFRKKYESSVTTYDEKKKDIINVLLYSMIIIQYHLQKHSKKKDIINFLKNRFKKQNHKILKFLIQNQFLKMNAHCYTQLIENLIMD